MLIGIGLMISFASLGLMDVSALYDRSPMGLEEGEATAKGQKVLPTVPYCLDAPIQSSPDNGPIAQGLGVGN